MSGITDHMETTSPPERRTGSGPWKWMVFGAVVGLVFVMAVILLDERFVHGESTARHLLNQATALMLWPAQKLFQAFGWQWDWISTGPWEHIPLFPILAVLVTNVVIFAVAGAMIGFVLKIVRRG